MRVDLSIQQAQLLRLVGGGRCIVRLVVILICWVLSSTASVASESDLVRFDIPQQRADVSLTQFAEQAGITLIFAYDLARGKTTNRLVGSHEPREAVALLLEGTGLRPTFSDDGFINITADVQSHAEGDQMEPKKKKGLLGLLGAVFLASPAAAQDPEALEEIVVTGYKASIEDALNQKRYDTRVIDAISAKDIGDFPDENIAESIQRIPGVQIERSRGRGALISLRGLGPEFTNTTLNGQSFASAQFNSGFRFDIIQSELASAVQVIKSPSADLQEGGLSGTVNIDTARPLSFDSRRVLANIESSYVDDRNSTSIGGNFTYIDQFNDDKVGALLNVAYQEFDTRFDLMFSQRFSDVDQDGDGNFDVIDGIPVERTDRPRLRREDGTTERLLINGALQFRPADRHEINLTAVAALDDKTLNFQQLVPLFSGGNPSPTVTILGLTGPTATQILAENIRVEANHTLQTEDRTSTAFTTDWDWSINDDWHLNSIAHYTAGKIDIVERAFVLGIRSDLEVDYSDVDNPILISSGLNPVSDPNSWAPENLFRNDIDGKVQSFETDELSLQLDLERSFSDSGFFRAFKTGLSYRAQTLDTTNTRFARRFRPGDSDGNGVDDILDAPFPTVAESNVVVSGWSGGEFPGLGLNYVLPDASASLEAFLNSPFEFEPNFQPQSFFEIERDILSAYGMLEFGTERLRGNIGLRYTDTSRKVDTVDFDSGLSVEFGAANIITTDGVPSSNSFDYDDVLPSLNLAFDVTDDIVLRAAAGSVLVRPVIGSTASFSRSFQAVDDGTDVIVTVNEGSARLPALTADQFDLSAEWYFGPASAISIGYFYKDVSNQTVSELVCPEDFTLADVSVTDGECRGTDGNIWNIFRTRVFDGSVILDGFEVAYTQAFDFLPRPFDGLGVTANYTTLNADNPNEDQPLLGSSDETLNVIVYYEKGNFSGRIALNRRSDYIKNDGFIYGRNFNASSQEFPNPGGLLEARNQIDFSASYEFNDNWKVSVEGINVNNDFEHATRFHPGRLQSVATFGSTYFFRVRYAL